MAACGDAFGDQGRFRRAWARKQGRWGPNSRVPFSSAEKPCPSTGRRCASAFVTRDELFLICSIP